MPAGWITQPLRQTNSTEQAVTFNVMTGSPWDLLPTSAMQAPVFNAASSRADDPRHVFVGSIRSQVET